MNKQIFNRQISIDVPVKREKMFLLSVSIASALRSCVTKSGYRSYLLCPYYVGSTYLALTANFKLVQMFGGPNAAIHTFVSAKVFSEQARKFALICPKKRRLGDEPLVSLTEGRIHLKGFFVDQFRSQSRDDFIRYASTLDRNRVRILFPPFILNLKLDKGMNYILNSSLQSTFV